MKIPLNWLREYVELSLPVAQFIERLTLAGLEVTGVRVIGLPAPEDLRVKPDDAGPVWDRDKIVVGRIIAVDRHPNADRLTLPAVDLGRGRTNTMAPDAPATQVDD